MLHRLLFAVIYFILTENLCLVQQVIDLFKKLVSFDSINRKRGYANADGNTMTGKIVELYRRFSLDQFPKPFCHLNCLLPASVRKKNDKFLSAVAKGVIDISQRAGDDLTDTSQYMVTSGMSELVIKLLKIVNIKHDD